VGLLCIWPAYPSLYAAPTIADHVSFKNAALGYVWWVLLFSARTAAFNLATEAGRPLLRFIFYVSPVGCSSHPDHLTRRSISPRSGSSTRTPGVSVMAETSSPRQARWSLTEVSIWITLPYNCPYQFFSLFQSLTYSPNSIFCAFHVFALRNVPYELYQLQSGKSSLGASGTLSPAREKSTGSNDTNPTTTATATVTSAETWNTPVIYPTVAGP
jgi:hypothetical protein